jgi:hypothetical protein
MSLNINNFDCRTIREGLVCDYLSPWDIGKNDEIARICTCKALNVVVFPDYKDLGKFTQELIKVQPIFDCPMLQKLRVDSKAPQMIASIDKNEFKTWHDD